MHIQESGEMYLESIYVLSQKMPHVRSVDVADYLEYSKPSVSVAMRHLREEELISVDGSGYITLLPKGRAIAERIFERHELLTSWLVHLGVPQEIASEDACRIEHVISEESFEALKNHVNNVY